MAFASVVWGLWLSTLQIQYTADTHMWIVYALFSIFPSVNKKAGLFEYHAVFVPHLNSSTNLAESANIWLECDDILGCPQPHTL
jgi:hypothetical protein